MSKTEWCKKYISEYGDYPCDCDEYGDVLCDVGSKCPYEPQIDPKTQCQCLLDDEKEMMVILRALQLAVPIWLGLGWSQHSIIAYKMIVKLEEAGV